jgi:transcription initiation factor TFIIIB Brf1 subunit/transcription initiation factor TFIIB
MDEEKITYAESDQNYARTQQTDEYTNDFSTGVSRRIKGSYTDSDVTLVRQTQTQDPKKKSLLQAKTSINQFSELLSIPDRVKEKAKGIFKELIEKCKRKPKGANSDCMILAILYLALKEDGCSRDFTDLARATKEVDGAKEIKKCYSKLLKSLPPRSGVSVGTGVAHDLVNRYALKLNLPKWLITIATDVAKNATPILEGKFPASVASASIYLACTAAKHKINENDIAAATASLQPSTILKSYRILLPHMNDLLPADFEALLGEKLRDTKK